MYRLVMMQGLLAKTRYRNIVAGSFRHPQKGPGSSASRGGGAARGQVRIIAGRWRGRKLSVPDVAGLRPTGDRVRETVFNWLQGSVAGAQCLDLFAGSGALGFEALSRYAQSCTFVEIDAAARRNLVHSCQLLDVVVTEQPVVSNSPSGEVLPDGDVSPPVAIVHAGTAQSSIADWLQHAEALRYDLVFIDPPFQLACQWEVLGDLASVLLADQALVYVESPLAQPVPTLLPRGCDIIREKQFGEVMARLVGYSVA